MFRLHSEEKSSKAASDVQNYLHSPSPGLILQPSGPVTPHWTVSTGRQPQNSSAALQKEEEGGGAESF